MSPPRLLRIRCAKWDQVESFYLRKVRADGRIAMRVPFDPELGTPVTLALEMPNQIVIAIDGTISQIGAAGGRVEVLLYGLTPALLSQLQSMVRTARDVDVSDEDAADDQHRLLAAREADLRRMRQLRAHELLGVPRHPSARELYAAWVGLARRAHPDTVARFASPRLTATADEATALISRAYDCMRAELVAAGRAIAIGATVSSVASGSVSLAASLEVAPDSAIPSLATAVDVVLDTTSSMLPAARPDVLTATYPLPGAVESSTTPSAVVPAAPELEPLVPPSAPVAVAPMTPMTPMAAMSAGPVADVSKIVAPASDHGDEAGERAGEPESSGGIGAGDRFLSQIRERLGAGDHRGAQQLAEAALHLHAGNRRLRGLQHVAMAMGACARNDRIAALSALETALTHDPASTEAARALETVSRAVTPTVFAMQRLFR